MSTADPAHASNTPLTSDFADDPEMAELIAFFSSELPKRVSAIEQSLVAHDLAGLHRLAHQIKGSAGGYGYPTIGQAAARLEKEAKQDQDRDTEALQQAADELIALCRRASAPPQG